MFRNAVGLLLAAMALSPACAERLSNAVIGLSIEKPAGWHMLTAKQNAQNLAEVELGSAEFQHYVRTHSSVPLIAFTRYEEPFEDVNASVKINTRPIGAFKGQPAKDVLESILPTLRTALSDLEVVTPPEAVTLASRPAAHMSVAYNLKGGGKSFPARSDMWIIPRGDYLVVVGAGYRPNARTGDREAVMKIVDSIQIND